ncbi:MAG TPA: cobyric acid synthase [Nocardioidaceae bacterium]|nr:cobyric acid synthase [Nocardioidaceae bacterium]
MSGSLLVAGTTSDAGKSVVTTGLCRALARRGISVAPYKAQNMSNNSMVVSTGSTQGWDFGEIGRAQWVQAVAARATPEVAMNPVLLKPGSDRRSHVVLMGEPFGTLDAGEFAGGRTALRDAAWAAYDDLRARYDVVVCEGAGSPAEINLRATDYVNMGLAQHGRIPTVVVGDIDRGGVFAAMYGTLALLSDEDQSLIAGWVINKFRGDRSLLEPGLEMLRARTNRPVYGVLPWLPDLWLDSEDALAILDRGSRPIPGERLKVAVVRLPRISNFTDVDALCVEPSVDVWFADGPRGLAGADVVLLPGTRATMADLAWMQKRGLADAVVAHARAGGAVLGICGGFQMLGTRVEDPAGVEGGGTVEGLGLLDVVTTFGADKVLRLPEHGYEIHHGRITHGDDERWLGGARRGSVFGTMWHGALESDDVRRSWLESVGGHSTASFPAAREARIEALADAVEEHLDVSALLELVS